MLFPQKVKSALWQIIDTMALNRSPFVKDPEKNFSRDRKLGFVHLLRFCICMASGCINYELLEYFFFQPDDVPSASAFVQQRAKLLPEAFRHILKQFNRRFPPDRPFNGEYSIIAADGCEFNIARNPKDPSTYHPASGKSKKGFNSIHTISLFDVISKRYLDVVVQPGRLKNEFAALCQLLDRYDYGGRPIFVADRGFASYNVLAHAIGKGYFFAIRAKDVNVERLLKVGELPGRVDQWVKIILTRSNAKKKRLHPKRGPLYRYISNKVPFDFITDHQPEYPMKLRVVRFQVKAGIYENILTNLPEDEFPTEVVKDIYGLRWGIETAFRDLKHTLGTTNFHSKSPEYIEHEILCRMVLYNFCSIISIEVPIEKKEGKWEYKVNLAMAIRTCASFLVDKVRPGNVNTLIRRYILPIRPDRDFERQLRFQPPPSFAYRFM